MNKKIKEIIQASADVKNKIAQNDAMLATIDICVGAIVTAFKSGNKVLFCGNGGSAADAQHLAAEFSGRFYTDRDALPAEALHCNTSYLTAVANDYGYDLVYSRIIKGTGNKGDVLVGLSTSGNSKNILNAFERIRHQRGPLGQYAHLGEGYYMFPELHGEIGSRMIFNGKEVVVWSINNYLGLANHPEVRKTDAEAAARWGLAYPMGARLMTGETSLHKELERKLAAHVYKEAAAVVNYGYPGVVSAIDALLSRRDAVVYDAESHGCIIDGTRLHIGERFSYKHNDIVSFEQNMERAKKWTDEKGGGILVVTEGVFGMRGDQGILKEIAALKKKYNFRFFVDDAHGFGTLGEGGRGAGVEQGCQDDIDVYFSTFAKSFACDAHLGAVPHDLADCVRFLLGLDFCLG